MKKYITVMNKWLITVTDLMKNVLIFAIISAAGALIIEAAIKCPAIPGIVLLNIKT